MGCLLVVFLLPGWGVFPSSGQERETVSEKQTTVALDLMDLDIPGEGGGDQMDLPPIQESEEPSDVARPPAPQQEPAEAELGKTEMPQAGRSVSSPMPGMVPFLLEGAGAGRGGGTTGAATKATEGPDPETLIKELPTELKTVPPPPSRAESLKLPSGLDAGTSGETSVPEIPLLKGEDRGQETPAPGGQDSSLTLKSFEDSREAHGAGRVSKPSRVGRRPEDYLQVREDIDSRLIEIYERYYKDR